MMDLQYHDVRRERGLYYRLVEAGRMRTLVGEEEVVRATREPPAETRAYFRGSCLARFPEAVSSASWDSVTFDVGEEALKRVPMPEPLRGSRALVGPLLERARDAGELLQLLGS
jgi:proteasome accessory factor A